MAKLLVKTVGVAIEVLELRLGVNRVGRAADNHFQIQHPTVSTHHCHLVLGDGTVLLRDCGSTNGTFVNGERVVEAPLQTGQTVRLGDVELFVETTEVTVAIPHYDRPLPSPPVVLADGAIICPRHPHARATHQCTHCRELMCDGCVHHLRRRGGKVFEFCPPVQQSGGTDRRAEAEEENVFYRAQGNRQVAVRTRKEEFVRRRRPPARVVTLRPRLVPEATGALCSREITWMP
ncbi:MAG: FHA domain-containing protein [Pedosphaera sp.]|nr:FHA domain-containing protein [Pedosphaera sp.]